MKRTASATWRGGLKDGIGSISSASHVLDQTPYSFGTRFAEGTGTNPEELIAAAHAGCFSMALSAQLGEAGLTATEIRTTATVQLEKDAERGGWAVIESHLDVHARIPGARQDVFEKAANAAETGCPISKLLNARISMDTHLDS
ncbi:MAG TPA: OsmC family protein [Bryobacteraceae bacterium]|nr:OsmC family protein [Bryobacteraceae bacterium]